MLSVIIPSRKEIFLNKTIEDVLKKAEGDIEVIVILDGYNTEEIKDSRVKYIRFPETKYRCKKRQGINAAVDMAQGKYVMSLDAHCMIAKGFDLELERSHQPDWVQVPRRHRLDAENWSIQIQSDDRPPIDYEYIMYPLNFPEPAFHGYKWDSRTWERADIMIDEIIEFQGSCWFMEKEWFKKMNFMDLAYQGWGQEAEEISFTTWKNGGKCVVNKNTWYAHLHKGKKYGRMYFMDRREQRKSYEYAFKRWVSDPDFERIINKFMPMPKWEEDWMEKLKRTLQ